jgi:hypothetical protein
MRRVASTPIHARHPYVHQDHCRAKGLSQLRGGDAVGCFADDLKSRPLVQDGSQGISQLLVVVDDEDVDHGAPQSGGEKDCHG